MNKLAVSFLLLMATAPAMATQYVFPENGQNQEQQTQDEAYCSQWATNETGVDPMALASAPTTTATPPAPTSPPRAQPGSGLRGAARGAVAGEIMEEVDDDFEDWGEKGAALGAIRGRHQSRMHSAQQQSQYQSTATAQAEQQAALNDYQMSEFYQARSVCLEAKGYSVSGS